MKQTWQKWDEGSLTKLKELYDQRRPIKEIAFEMGRNIPSVKSALRNYGIVRSVVRAEQVIKELSEADLAYIAGIVDGEGSILIEKRTTTLLNGERNPLYHAALKVGNNDERLIDWLMAKVGGGYKSTDEREGLNTQYKWVLSQSMTLQLLEKLKPYMVIKQEQVDLVYRFRESYCQVYSRRGTPKEIVEFREQCYRTLQSMHGGKRKEGKQEIKENTSGT